MTYKIFFENSNESRWMTRKELKEALKSLLDQPWLILREESNFTVVNSNFNTILEVFPRQSRLVDRANFYKQGEDVILAI